MVDLNKIIADSGTNKILAIHTLRINTKIGLAEAKEIIDSAYEMKKRNPKANVNSLLRNEYINFHDDTSIKLKRKIMKVSLNWISK